MPSGCPFSSGKGYTTIETRNEWLNAHPNITLEHDFESFAANLDTTEPLYYWQIFSIWGQKPILKICTDFYDSVYEQDDKFAQVFKRAAPKSHHIRAQAAYWIDAMGGGKVYHGGIGRLQYHHMINAGSIMNAKGSKLWMHHMKKSISKNQKYFDQDPRILPSLLDFLETKMKIYAEDHCWEFDSSDFEIKDFLVR